MLEGQMHSGNKLSEVSRIVTGAKCKWEIAAKDTLSALVENRKPNPSIPSPVQFFKSWHQFLAFMSSNLANYQPPTVQENQPLIIDMTTAEQPD